MERCPICGVSVKAENLLRHVEDNHPKHPDTGKVRQALTQEARFAPSRAAPRGRGLRAVQIAAIVGIVLVIGGFVWAAPLLFPPATFGPESCISETQTHYHIHVGLTIVIDGSQVAIPWNTGIEPGCTHPLHTHDNEYDPSTQPARIHIESPVVQTFTLGDFFVVWGRRTLTPTQVLGCVAPPNVISMTVDVGQGPVPSTAFGTLPLADGQQIRITCGPAA